MHIHLSVSRIVRALFAPTGAVMLMAVALFGSTRLIRGLGLAGIFIGVWAYPYVKAGIAAGLEARRERRDAEWMDGVVVELEDYAVYRAGEHRAPPTVDDVP